MALRMIPSAPRHGPALLRHLAAAAQQGVQGYMAGAERRKQEGLAEQLFGSGGAATGGQPVGMAPPSAAPGTVPAMAGSDDRSGLESVSSPGGASTAQQSPFGLTPQEQQLGMSMVAGGATPAQALQAIQAQRPPKITPYQQESLRLRQAEAERPHYESFVEGTEKVTYQINPDGTRQEVSRGVAYAPPSQTTVKLPAQETEAAKAIGKATGERLPEINAASRAARDTLSTVSQFGQLLNRDLKTGAGARFRTWAKNTLGAELGDDTTLLQEADRLATDMVQKAQTQQTGPQTDSDRAVIQRTLPGIGRSPDANKLAVAVMKAQQQRVIDELAFERKYLAEGGDPWFVEDAIIAEFGGRDVFGPEIVTMVEEMGSSGAQEAVAREAVPFDQEIDATLRKYGL